MASPERYVYPAVFTFDEQSEIAVDFPDLKCATSGTDETDALLSARELLGCVLFGMEEDGEEIPQSSALTEVDTSINERAILVDVYMPPVRQELKVKKAEARKYASLRGCGSVPFA